MARGDHIGGQGLLLDQGGPTCLYGAGELHSAARLQAPESLTPGEHAVAVRFAASREDRSKTGAAMSAGWKEKSR